MPAAPDLKQLGRYRIDRVLGKGAMGVVYEGFDTGKLKRRVAIKTILKSNLDEALAKDYSARFAREAEAVGKLNHPHIVQVYDFGEEADVAFIVMEFIRGKDLKHCFDNNVRFEPREFVRLMCELLSALDYAHQAGIVHRDIKPANVMLDGQTRAKLMDFGVAKIQDTDRTHRTQVGTMVGTPSYMSPEQVQGLAVDQRSDLFSSGIVLYQFLTNQRPFTGGDWTLRKMIVHEDPVRPSQINTSLSPEFDRVISRALAKAPEARYQSAAEFGRALQRVFEGRPAEDEDDRTIMRPAQGAPLQAKPAAERSSTQATSTGTGSQEVEVEFWRSIKDSDDPEDFELYVQQFPRGAYAKLAERKIAKLRKDAGTHAGTASGAHGSTASGSYGTNDSAAAEAEELRKLEEEHRRQAEELARRQAEARKKAEAEARARREAEEKARREAEEKARREAEEKARREAEEKARREAEERARREAEERARREAAEKARREAEERARLEAERVRREAEAKAKREAEERAKREAEEKARREAEAKAKREAEEKAKREAEERAKREAEAKAKREAEEKAKREAEKLIAEKLKKGYQEKH